jgi:hypothetical protein
LSLCRPDPLTTTWRKAVNTSDQHLSRALHRLETEIRSEQSARAPNAWWLLKLKKLRLATKDRLCRLSGFRSQDMA